MRNHRAPSVLSGAGLAAVLFVLLFGSSTVLTQQSGPPGAPPPGNRDPFAEARDRQQREAQLRSAEMVGAAKTGERLDVGAAVEQLKDDFRGIQILRNKLVRRLQSGQPLDYKSVSREAEEVNKRALRLKNHLVREAATGEKKEPDKPVEISDEQMQDALATMCKRIDSFTENPVFKVPGVVDVEQTAKVNRDLRHILLLSGGIRKTAERLSKTHK